MTRIYQKEIPRYYVRVGGGDYATVALDVGQRCVTVMADSSFGSYCYHWNATGCNPVEFLRSLKFDSAMVKFRGEAFEIFDREAQEKVLRQRALARRRARLLDADDARWSLDEIEHVCDARSIDQFWTNLYHSELSKHLFNNEISQFSAETRPDPQCVGFWEAIWVPLMAHLGAGTDAAPVNAQEAANG